MTLSPTFWVWCQSKCFKMLVVVRKMLGHLQHRTIFLAVVIVAVGAFTVLWLQLPATLSALSPVTSWSHTLPRPLPSPSRLLPHKYWKHRHRYPEKYNQISCSNLPRLEDIHYAAASWQHLPVVNGSVYVYGAYWDDRFEEPLVRVLIYCDVTPLPALMCQFWYEGENGPITVPSTVTYGWRPAWGGPTDGINEPYILACRARRHPPENQQPPSAVSVVREDLLCGTPTNVLNVQGVPPEDVPQTPLNTERNLKSRHPARISVCLKWLHYRDDISASLVEWIEFIKAFGAQKLFVFEIQSHPNTRKVLDYYISTGFADVTEFAHPPQLRSNFIPSSQNFHDFRRELLPLNDCLYRSIQEYQWMTPIDSDEIIVPRSCETWQEIIAHETNETNGLDAMAFRMYYFLDPAQRDLAAPTYMKILGHLWRTRKPKPPGHNVKSFHNTSSVVAMHNHYPISCGSRSCWSRNVNETLARLHHYRARCADNSENCPETQDTVRDDTITKFKHVQAEVDRVLAMIGIKPNV